MQLYWSVAECRREPGSEGHFRLHSSPCGHHQETNGGDQGTPACTGRSPVKTLSPCKVLLDRGADILARDDNNRDCLSLADTFCGRTSELTKYLAGREQE